MNQSFEMNIGESGHFDAKKRLSVRLNRGHDEFIAGSLFFFFSRFLRGIFVT